ncbi:MAG: hypothetical protein NFW04_15705 [Candidatus Accumulibacter sp.]|uniref:hypothetical protein n=1 Tax=Accumulibacter sp. TaxID=2053492 RepID=UPI0025D786FD|nr:hypothetical protein [Accumulibacter sp.]MCM8600076.1 hypothetical protein [Accumulibacter sp.]MCM8663533.1 hypothetical protein [Accumulibacter sp.]
MNIAFVIGGREAIPVRAIPYVTGWWMSPDVVAKSLAYRDSMNNFDGVRAYQLSADGACSPMLPKEWDGVDDRLKGLDAKLKAMSDDKDLTRPIWLAESIPLLPGGVFLWKDEFEQAFCQGYSPQRLDWIDERPGDRELNFSPLIPVELRDVVIEGFRSDDARSERVAGHGGQNRAEQPLPTAGTVSVNLPHLPKALAAVFQIMRNNWTDYDPRRIPKQVNIAKEIDCALGWKADRDGGPSRNAKTVAMLIKPDAIDDTE